MYITCVYVCMHIYICLYIHIHIGPPILFWEEWGGGGGQGVSFMFLLFSEYTDKICIVVILRLSGKCGTITSVPVCPSF